MSKEKRQSLNAEKRKVIAEVFQDHFESNSKYKAKHTDAIQTYNDMRSIAKTKIEQLVRFHQPQEDVDTIRSMINKYGERNGGELHHDNCFYVQDATPRMETDYNGNPKEVHDDVHIKFKAEKDFLTSYYRDEIRAKGLDPDYEVRLGDDYGKRSPSFYNSERDIDNYLGYNHTNNDVSSNQSIKPKQSWANDFRIWVIGSSYCHNRMFQIGTEEFKWYKSFEVAKDNVVLAHKKLFEHVDEKMQKLKLGLKSYRYFDQAKELADKLGVVLNESVLDANSSMALSIYSPTNLADLLTDEVELTKDEKIAIAKAQMKEQLISN
jgi:hypothetical protein